ncbi:hypothetical protein ACIHFC_01620 [Streptomyces sp. NPDC052013]|uniref:hypothetical protein n=1 Tax=Streptomyces sp. NPDC052013 TaxID=3365679 RepID=UPI0037CD8406
MRALPARRLALSALCAALLVGITGPAALAADPVHERSKVAAPGAALPGADALLARVEKLDAQAGPLTPVVDLMEAVLQQDRTTLSPAEVRKLGDAAKDALRKAAADEQPVVTLVPTEPTTTGVLLPAADAELTNSLLGGLLDLLGGILDLLLPGLTEDAATADTTETTDTTDDATDVVTEDTAADAAEDAADEAADEAAEAAETAAEDAPADTEVDSFDSLDEFIDRLLAEVDALIEAVIDPDLAASTTDTATSSTVTTTPTATATTLPALTPQTSVVLMPAS